MFEDFETKLEELKVQIVHMVLSGEYSDESRGRRAILMDFLVSRGEYLSGVMMSELLGGAGGTTTVFVDAKKNVFLNSNSDS